MKRITIVLALLCAQVAFGQQPAIKEQIQGDVVFVSGGVGGDEQQAMQAMRGDYNVYMLFSVKGTGKYVSDVVVRIDDANGNSLMESMSEGPMLFARLKPGRYNVIANRDGQIQQKTAAVTGNRKVSLFFTWPRQEDD
jgi:hypothetical protein